MERNINPTYIDIVYLYDQKLIGFSEARNLLEQILPQFVQARDRELDTYMTMTEQAQDDTKSLTDKPPEPPE